MSKLQLVILSIILVLLILLAAFFACAETGLMAVNRYRLRHKARLKKRYAIRLLNLLKRPDRVLGAILIGSTFANMLASSLATLLAFDFGGGRAAFIADVFLILAVLIFAEIAPKTVAAFYPDQVSRWVAFPIQLFLKLTYPIVWMANGITSAILKLLHIHVTHYAVEPLSREELRSVVHETAGKISRQYQSMLLSILDLNKLTVDDVMIPRHDMVGINIEQPWEKIVADFHKLQQDWLPLYRENINQLIGVFHAHDLFRLLLENKEFNQEMLLQLMHEPYFVPEGTSLHVQLAYFQRTQQKIAFVVDEYGEIQGVLTLNDILEEIVGDFTTNMTALSKRIQEQSDGSYIVDGAMTIREFNRVTGWELPLSGPRTINGMITEHLETLPRTGTAVLIASYPIEILQVQNNRVKTARLFPLWQSPDKNPEEETLT